MLWFLLIILIKAVISDQFFSSTFSVVDQCIDVCKKSEFAPLNTKERIICERGCRFFNIIHFKDESNLNQTKYECYNSCNESYSRPKDLKLCRNGCELMANKREHDTTIILISDSTNLFVAAAIESDLEIIESDLFSDPSIRNQLDIDLDIDYKIPETRIRTMPIEFNYNNNNNNDKDDEMIFIKTTNHQHNSNNGDWLDCASKNFGLPRWILLSAILSIVLIALWLSFSFERREHDEFLIGEHLIDSNKHFDLLENCDDYKFVIESEKV